MRVNFLFTVELHIVVCAKILKIVAIEYHKSIDYALVERFRSPWRSKNVTIGGQNLLFYADFPSILSVFFSIFHVRKLSYDIAYILICQLFVCRYEIIAAAFQSTGKMQSVFRFYSMRHDLLPFR